MIAYLCAFFFNDSSVLITPAFWVLMGAGLSYGRRGFVTLYKRRDNLMCDERNQLFALKRRCVMKKRKAVILMSMILCVFVLTLTPAMAAKKTTVLLPKKISFSSYDYEKKKWKSYRTYTASYNKNGLIKSFEDMWKDVPGSEKAIYKYNKQGLLKSIKLVNYGYENKVEQYNYKWKKGKKKCTVSSILNGKTIPGNFTLVFNKEGKLLSQPEYTYKYTKNGKIKQIVHKYLEEDDDDEKSINRTDKKIYEYDKNNKLISEKEFIYGNTLSYDIRYLYKNNKLVKVIETDYEWDENGKRVKYVNYINIKYKGDLITVNERKGDGSLRSVTVYNRKFKVYNPIPDINEYKPEAWEFKMPYQPISSVYYDSDNITGIMYKEVRKYKIYKKGVKKGLPESCIITHISYDEEDGEKDIEKIKITNRYVKKKMTKYNIYLQSSFYGFQEYRLSRFIE